MHCLTIGHSLRGPPAVPGIRSEDGNGDLSANRSNRDLARWGLIRFIKDI
jgi:hypothetical protein